MTEHIQKRWKTILGSLLVVVTAFLVSRYAFQMMLVQGDSMSPLYHDLQLVFINKYSRIFRTGDVIAFECEGLDAVLVKRIAAGPGDRVESIDGRLFVNGEPYYDCLWTADYVPQTGISIENGAYFVIGDNFEESKDSRFQIVGMVFKKEILGKLIPNIPYFGD